MQNIPTGIKLVSVFFILSGLVTIIFGINDLYSSKPTLDSYYHIFYGITAFITVYGIGERKGWARTLAVILCVLNIIFAILSIVLSDLSVIEILIISIIVLYYLYRPRVKSYFDRGIISLNS